MDPLARLLGDTSLFPSLRALAPRPGGLDVAGLDGSAPAVAIALRHLARGKAARTLVVAPDARAMELVRDDLGALLGDESVLPFPGLDLKPYEWRTPFGHALEQRLNTLESLRRAARSGEPALAVTTLSAFGQRLAAPERLHADILVLRKGDAVDLPALRHRLERMGFAAQPLCEELGTYSVRGGILDVFPYALDNPVRIELWGDQVESIRPYDLFTQRSQAEELAEVEILPMDEGLPDGEVLQEGLLELLELLGGEERQFERERARLEDEGDRTGFVWQKPFFGAAESSLLDHLGEGAEVFLLGADPGAEQDAMLVRAAAAWADARGKGHAVAPPERIWFAPAELGKRLAAVSSVRFAPFLDPAAEGVRIRCRAQERAGRGMAEMGERLRTLRGEGVRVTLLSANNGQAQRLQELISDVPVAGIAIGHLSGGFLLPDDGQAWYTDHQIFNRFARRVRQRRQRGGVLLHDFEALSRGDFVVHENHGIGKYLGIERIEAGGESHDCIVVQYEGRASLRLPVSDLRRLQKYGSEEGAEPKLDKLGGKSWENLKEKTRKAVAEMARELVELYAARSVAKGYAFPPDDHFQTEFEDEFPWDLTPDQARAVAEVKNDLESPQPMDRLVCGDVGFGKTEVAVRAIFKVVMARRQVALLVPTTILSAQHHATLIERFADWPIRVEVVNRFVPPARQKQILADVKAGKVDVLVGTHRLLGRDVEFRDIGLVVLDEEQKFGVAQKEKLKEMRREVDVLSLSATPIPRTLHMSLSGVRDLSIIATPPRNRLPIETRVAEIRDTILEESVRDELARGGQVFVVVPRIEHLENAAARLEMLVPEARIAAGHGQMKEDDLEQVMSAFLNRDFDVLVSTTIIESGLDIPSVNTILVLDAHRFGLSQLHQLRGRVGRSDVKGFCWLLVPRMDGLQRDAVRRLQALEQFTDLGSGYAIAMRDLEIRGAGNLLGHKQHGFVAAVGFETYCRILQEAVEQLQGKEHLPPLEPKIEFSGAAFLPDDYVGEPAIRIQLYQRIARASSAAEIDAMREEFRDRFGPVPEPARQVLRIMAARLAARQAGVAVAGIARGRAILEFDDAYRTSVEELRERTAGARPRLDWMTALKPLRLVADVTGYPSEAQQEECVNLLRMLSGENPEAPRPSR